MSPFNDQQIRTLPIDLFGGLVAESDPSNVPEGASPLCTDCEFEPGSVFTRRGLSAVFPAIAGNPTINYLKTGVIEGAGTYTFALDSTGSLWLEDIINNPGNLALVSSALVPGCFGYSDTDISREYFAFSDGNFGSDMPRQYDGANFDRVSQCGPGAAPTVADGGAGLISAGLHQFSVAFVTRQGYITALAPPGSWTAAGAKVAAVTNIPVGPPNVVARLFVFTAANSNFFFTTNEGITQPIAIANSSMLIPDNITTTATVNFTDASLLASEAMDQPGNNRFAVVELGECLGCIGYADRMFWWGERNKLQNFINLTFDGGFGVAGGAPTQVTVGPDNPSAATNDATGLGLGGIAWADPTNVFAIDGVAASSAMPVSYNSQYLKATGYGFAIPSNATIVGIVVTARVKGSNATDLSDYSVFLVKAGSRVGSDHGNGNIWSNAFANQVYGSNVDLWGTSWTPTDINNANFGVEYAALSNSLTNTRTALIDWMGITVSYTTPASGASVGPLGWTQTANYAGGQSALTAGLTAVWGDAFAIEGDGLTAIRGQITQRAYTDFYGIPILSPGTAYRVRARVASAGGLAVGTLHINLQSTIGGFVTPGLSVQANQLTGAYKEFDALLTSSLSTLPTDLLLQVYADGTPTNGGYFLVDNIEIYPVDHPYNDSQVRVSYIEDPESFDGVTGLLGISEGDGQQIRAAFKFRENLYFVKDRSLYGTADNGSTEPSGWTINQISRQIGTTSVNGVARGEDWESICNEQGIYLFNGSEPVKMSQEIQSDRAATSTALWDTVNWAYGQRIWSVNDTRARQIFIGVPVGETNTCNAVFMVDYKELNTSAMLGAEGPIHTSYSGKVITWEPGRKWSPWTMTMSAGAMITRPNQQNWLLLGNGSGNGLISTPLPGQLTDNGAQIPWIYTTYGIPSRQQEEMLQLSPNRKFFSLVTAYIQGTGLVSLQAFPLSLSNPGPSYVVTPSSIEDIEIPVHVAGERVFWQWASGGVGSTFRMRAMATRHRPHSWARIRHVN